MLMGKNHLILNYETTMVIIAKGLNETVMRYGHEVRVLSIEKLIEDGRNVFRVTTERVEPKPAGNPPEKKP